MLWAESIDCGESKKTAVEKRSEKEKEKIKENKKEWDRGEMLIIGEQRREKKWKERKKRMEKNKY